MYLDILHVFHTLYPKRVQDTFRIHIRYIKIHKDTCILLATYVSALDTYQDTSGYMYLGIFITIQDQDTKLRYM